MTPSPFRLRGRLLTAAVLAAVLVLGVVAVVWARGGRDDRPPEAAGPSTSSTVPGSPTATTDPPVEPTTSRDGGLLPRVIQWINEQAPLGGGASGNADEAFDALLRGDCPGALRIVETGELGEPVRSVYQGAASACLAAFEGRPELWPQAEAAAARAAGRASRLACEEQAIYRLLGRLLAAHRADPEAPLARGPVGVRGRLACPRFTAITPDHGPAEGGYPVRITGEHLPRTVGVNFGQDHYVEAVTEDDALTITVPPAASPDDLEVFVEPAGAAGTYGAAAVTFTYDPPSSSGSSTTEPTTSTPEPPDPSAGSSVPPPPPSS